MRKRGEQIRPERNVQIDCTTNNVRRFAFDCYFEREFYLHVQTQRVKMWNCALFLTASFETHILNHAIGKQQGKCPFCVFDLFARKRVTEIYDSKGQS